MLSPIRTGTMPMYIQDAPRLVFYTGYGMVTDPTACQLEFAVLLRAARKNTWSPAKL